MGAILILSYSFAWQCLCRKRVRLASRNIPRVTVFVSRGTNVYDLLKHDIVVMTQGAVQDVTNFLRSPVNR